MCDHIEIIARSRIKSLRNRIVSFDRLPYFIAPDRILHLLFRAFVFERLLLRHWLFLQGRLWKDYHILHLIICWRIISYLESLDRILLLLMIHSCCLVLQRLLVRDIPRVERIMFLVRLRRLDLNNLHRLAKCLMSPKCASLVSEPSIRTEIASKRWKHQAGVGD